MLQVSILAHTLRVNSTSIIYRCLIHTICTGPFIEIPTYNNAFNSYCWIFVPYQALEYAKTIAKPKAPPLKERPKDKTESERLFERSACFQLGVDLTEQSTLEMLKKRHEQEKQIVEHFTEIHGKSSAPSVNS